MKKVLRVLLVCAGVALLLVAVAVVLAFQSPVQTWAARKAVASAPPGVEISIGRVSAGLNKTEVSGIRVRQPGLAFDLPSATVEVSLTGLMRGRVDIKKIVAKGWTVDVSQPAPASEPTSAPVVKSETKQPEGKEAGAPAKQDDAAFSGIFDLMKLPVDLTVAEVDVDGVIILPPREAGAQAGRVTVSARGGGLAAGSDAKFGFDCVADMPGAGAPVSKVQLQAAFTARMDTPRSFKEIGFDTEASATGAQFPQGARIRAQVAAKRGAEGEEYLVALRAGEKNLASLKVSNPAGGKGFAADWSVDVKDADLAPFIAGIELQLPAFVAIGQGNVSADGAFQTVRASGKLSADLSKLETLDANLGMLGRVNFTGNFDLVREGDLVRVGALSADIAVNAAPIFSVKVLQIVEVNIATSALKVPDLNADLVRVDIAGVPLEWVQAFLKDAGFAVTGGPLRGSLAGRAVNGGFSLRSVAPMTLGGLSVAQEQQRLVDNVDVSTEFAADYTPAAWSVAVSGLSLQSRGATLLTLNAKAAGPGAQAGGDSPAISTTGELRANLGALMAQPAAADFRLVTSGAASLDFSARLAPDVQQVHAKFAVSNLKANDQAGTAVPNVTADLRADVRPGGEITVQAPVVFEMNSRKSDIELSATLTPAGARQNIDAVILSNAFHIEDLQKFAALAPAPGAPATTGSPAPAPSGEPAKPDTKAAWDAITGQLKIDIEKLVYSPDMLAASATGLVKITPSRLSLENFYASTTDGAEAKINGAVNFDASGARAAQPYGIDSKLNVTNFDPAPILRAANPGKRPTVEGKFDIAGTVTGKAATLDTLADSVAADLTLASRGGKFNGFATSVAGEKFGQIQKLANSPVGTAVIGGVLSLIGGKAGVAADATIEKAKAVNATLGRLIEVNFDQMNIDVSYQPGRETVVKNFSILSPDMRLVSNGKMGNKTKISWLRQAVSLAASMSVRGDQAGDLRTLGLLKAEADAAGFASLKENFSIEGTVAGLTIDPLVKKLMDLVPGLQLLK